MAFPLGISDFAVTASASGRMAVRLAVETLARPFRILSATSSGAVGCRRFLSGLRQFHYLKSLSVGDKHRSSWYSPNIPRTVTTSVLADMEALSGETAQLAKDYMAMWRIRLFEEAVQRLRADNVIVGSVHLSNGQEAIPVGVLSEKLPQDAVFATYRGHGWALACGTPPELMFAELAGRETGVNGGRGGSAYFSAPDVGFYGENSIVGGALPIAVGAALAARYDGSARIAICSFGEGAMNQGAVHEAFNFASAFDLPIVFVCENNGYSELTPSAEMVKDGVFASRADGYGMRGCRVNGNDPAEVRAAMRTAATRARDGSGPTLIEAMTSRIVGHYIGDLETYRTKEEMRLAREQEPIAVARRRLAEAGVQTESIAQLDAACTGEIESAVQSALAAPLASGAPTRHVYGS